MDWLTAAKSLSNLYYHAPLLFILVAVTSAFLLRKAALGRTKQWPPGPPAWPVIGHLHLLGELPHQSLCKLAQSYGPLMGLRLGGVPTVVASSPEMAKEILQTQDLAFASRPRLTAAMHMYFDCGDMGFAPYGPFWKLMRQICASEVFATKRLNSFRHVWEEEIRELQRSVLEKGRQGGEEVELRACIRVAANNTICRMATGKRIAEICDEESRVDLLSSIGEMVHLLGVFYVGDFIPWLAWLDPCGYLKRMKATGQRTKVLMQAVIDKRLEESQQEARPQNEDLLDVLLAASQNKDHTIKITHDNIKAVILDLLVAGSDTSSLTVEWTLAELINNPKVMEKMQEELDNVVGRARHVEERDIKNLHYLNSVLKESMRLHPVAPLLMPHESIQECYIGDHKIPAKTRAYINTWAIGRDGATWERPLDFWPERFDDTNLDLQGQNFELLPFGSGRRKCPASAMGLLIVRLKLATLVHSFAWSLESPNSPNEGSHMRILDMSEKVGAALLLAKPLRAFATPRLPMHLY